MTLPERLKALLESRGFTVVEAAAAAGMTKQQAWGLVVGRNPNPGYFTLQRLVSAIGCGMSELTEGGDLEMPPLNTRKGRPGPKPESRPPRSRSRAQ